MNNTVSSITVKKKNVYTIKIMDENGKYTGNKLEFKLDDVDLMLKLEKAAEEVDKIKNNIKMQQVIISKRQDVPGKYVLSKNEQDLYNLYSNGYKNIRKAMDNFLGENGCQKVFGDTNSLEMFDDLMEMLKPEFSKMGLSIENLKNRIKSKYSDKKENVI